MPAGKISLGWLFPLGLLLLMALCPAAGLAENPPQPFSIDHMMAIRRIADPQVSPDGGSVVFSVTVPDRTANRMNHMLYLGNLTDKTFQPLSALGQQATNPRWSPDGSFIYFLASPGGLQQVWRLAVKDRRMEAVTHLPIEIDSFDIEPGGRYLLLATSVFPGKTPAQTEALLQGKKREPGSGRLYDRLMVRQWDAWRDGTRKHLLVYNLEDCSVRDLLGQMDADSPLQPLGGTEDYTVSPDGKLVVFTAKNEGRQEAWSNNTDLFLVPVDGSAPPRRITTNPAADILPRFSPDGQTLAYLTADRPGHEADCLRIVLRSMETEKSQVYDLRCEECAFGDRSPDALVWSPDGKQLYLTADHLGQHALFALDVRTGRSIPFMKAGASGSPRPLPDGRVLFTWSSLQRPAELYLAGLHGEGNQRLTKLNDELMETARLGKVNAFEFKGHAGRTVHGRIVYPADFDSRKKYPVAFVIHGGPQTSNLNEFSYRWNPQIFAGAGYAVVMIDYTGSTGYGQAFTDAVSGDWGGAPYEDLMTGLRAALDRYPFLDRERMAALGPSFGGYMVYWLAGQKHPFRCLVSHAGIFDRERFFYQTDELWFAEWETGGLPWLNPEGHKRHNPADLVKNWLTPMLVIHGEKDYRVPYVQGLSAFTALQRKGIPSKFLIFPDEGHWVLKPQNSRQWYKTVLDWLDQWVKP